MSTQLVYTLSVWAIPVLFAITMHEVAHGWVAMKRGDTTAASLGRLSLNPLKHIDPIGTLVVPVLLLVTTSFVFGWAKPVPVVASRLNNPRQDMRWVALAGPVANILMAIVWMVMFRLVAPEFNEPSAAQQWALEMARAGVFINILLAVFNLLPIPPLDGGRVLMTLLPNSVARQIAPLEQFGLLLVVALMLTGILGKVLYPLMAWTQSLLVGLVM